MFSFTFFKRFRLLPLLAFLVLFLSGISTSTAQYCSVSFDCSMGDQIEDFYTTGAIQDITNMGSGCSPGGYGDFTGTHTLEVAPGSTFTVHVQTDQIAAWDQGFTIWIDWDQNGVFDPVTEEVWNSGTYGTQLFTGTVTVPPTADTGITTMRVMASYYCVPTDPCMGCDPYGEAEDYKVIVSSPPSCLQPDGLTASNITPESAELDWTENNVATQWEIEWGDAGFSQGAGNTVITGTKPYTVTGLTDLTAYDFYVRSICDTGDTSYWAGPQEFYTPVDINCPASPQISVFTEDWDAGQGGWTGNIGTSNGEWQLETGPTPTTNTGPAGPHQGSQYMFFEASGAGSPGSATMVSPSIDLTTGVDTAVLSFWIHAYGSDVPGATLTIGAGTSATGPFTPVYDTTFASEVQTASSDPYVQQFADLTAYQGQTVYLEVYYDNPNSYESDLAIDLIEVLSCLDCTSPPVVDLGVDSLFACANETITIGAGDVYDSYNWSTGHTTDSITIDTAGIGTGSKMITLTVGDAQGCMDTDTVIVTFLETPQITIHTPLGPATDSLFVCAGDTVQLMTDAFHTYYWSTGDTTQSIYLDTSGTGTGSQLVTLEVADHNGCYSQDTLIVVFMDAPVISIVGPDTVMADETPTFSVDTGYAAYLWSTGHTTHEITIDSTYLTLFDFTTLAVTVTNDEGCETTVSKEVFLGDPSGVGKMAERLDIRLYPNPGQGIFTLELSEITSSLDMQVLNVNGQLVFSQQINPDQTVSQFDLSNLAAGVYYLRLTNDATTKTKKLIIR